MSSGARKKKTDADETYSSFDGSEGSFSEDSTPSAVTSEQQMKSVLDEAFEARTVIQKRPAAPVAPTAPDPDETHALHPPMAKSPPPQQKTAKQPKPEQPKQEQPKPEQPKARVAKPVAAPAPVPPPPMPAAAPTPPPTLQVDTTDTEAAPSSPSHRRPPSFSRPQWKRFALPAGLLAIVMVVLVLRSVGSKRAVNPDEPVETFSKPSASRSEERNLSTQHVLDQFDQAFGQTQGQVQADPHAGQ